MAITAPKLAAAPTAAELSAVTCPVDRARRITAISRACGTLPRHLADLRRAALNEARALPLPVGHIAAQVGLSQARISQLTTPPTRTGTPDGRNAR